MEQEMKLLIVSDTHGDTEALKILKALKQYAYIFHCGDFCIDPSADILKDTYVVRGNNDFYTEVPFEQAIDLGGIVLYLTHGHLHQVDYSLARLGYAAEEIGAQIVLFGHTHFPLALQDEGIIFINPGSLKRPRGYASPTYAELTLTKQQNASVQVKVEYYTPSGLPVPALKREFNIQGKQD